MEHGSASRAGRTNILKNLRTRIDWAHRVCAHLCAHAEIRQGRNASVAECCLVAGHEALVDLECGRPANDEPLRRQTVPVETVVLESRVVYDVTIGADTLTGAIVRLPQ